MGKVVQSAVNALRPAGTLCPFTPSHRLPLIRHVAASSSALAANVKQLAEVLAASAGDAAVEHLVQDAAKDSKASLAYLLEANAEIQIEVRRRLCVWQACRGTHQSVCSSFAARKTASSPPRLHTSSSRSTPASPSSQLQLPAVFHCA